MGFFGFTPQHLQDDPFLHQTPSLQILVLNMEMALSLANRRSPALMELVSDKRRYGDRLVCSMIGISRMADAKAQSCSELITATSSNSTVSSRHFCKSFPPRFSDSISLRDRIAASHSLSDVTVSNPMRSSGWHTDDSRHSRIVPIRCIGCKWNEATGLSRLVLLCLQTMTNMLLN